MDRDALGPHGEYRVAGTCRILGGSRARAAQGRPRGRAGRRRANARSTPPRTSHGRPAVLSRSLARVLLDLGAVPNADPSSHGNVGATGALTFFAYFGFGSVLEADAMLHRVSVATGMTASRDLGAVRNADASRLGKAGAARVAASADLCPVLVTHSPFDGFVVASCVRASLGPGPVLDADPSLHGVVGTAGEATRFDLGPVLAADASVRRIVGASRVVACFPLLCALAFPARWCSMWRSVAPHGCPSPVA